MTEDNKIPDLNERLHLIETMIAEGRRSTESWGWVFVLWGIAYYVAIVWSAHGGNVFAWPVTMIAAAIISGLTKGRRTRDQPATTIERAIGSVWVAMGLSLFILLMALGWSGRLTDARLAIAIVAAMLGLANLASSMILRWRVQFGSAVAWLAASAVVCYVADNLVIPVFVGAIFLCQIVFGLYGMLCEVRKRKLRGASHA
jgi:hypothetical protein